MNTNVLPSLSDLDLPIKVSAAMKHVEPIMHVQGDKLIVGYLTDDYECLNPLLDYDGNGCVVSMYQFKSTEGAMQDAFGLGSDSMVDVDLVNEHIDRLKSKWTHFASASDEFREWANETAGPTASYSDAYYLRRARKYWSITDGEFIDGESNIDDFEFTLDVRLELWRELREERLIGNPDVVLLDCYEHGNQHWSVSGEGMHYRWNTSSGAGVWIPDDCAKEVIDSRAKVYAFGHVNRTRVNHFAKQEYVAVLDKEFGGQQSTNFKSWSEAFAWLEDKVKKFSLPRGKSAAGACVFIGRERAAVEMAREALELYNEWLLGSTYGVVEVQYDIVREGDNVSYEFIESEKCWDFIGSDNAMAELKHRILGANQEAA